MKNFFPDEKENNGKALEKTEPDRNCPEYADGLVVNISCIRLMRIIKKDRKFFNISAKLSIYSN
ncbi:MAG: hypothetical protein KAS21_00455 [Candidatus Aminicenantes bacterium]|nr:hypothetical protein [Candidatus Aminicenantes bacterium]MCK5003525.1 hypothetical protein [Candidatus Aminicenantes bacterium]